MGERKFKLTMLEYSKVILAKISFETLGARAVDYSYEYLTLPSIYFADTECMFKKLYRSKV